MQQIFIKEEGLLVQESVFVNKSQPECLCDIDSIRPENACNLPFINITHIDATCGGIITSRKMQMYNQLFGFSGYDELDDDKQEGILECSDAI